MIGGFSERESQFSSGMQLLGVLYSCIYSQHYVDLGDFLKMKLGGNNYRDGRNWTEENRKYDQITLYACLKHLKTIHGNL